MTEQNKTPLTAQPGSAPAPEQKPAEKRPAEKPLRRVGSLTLGACLIAAGVFFLLYFFVPGFDVQLTLKIAPAVALVLLGCEVLFFAARLCKREQYKKKPSKNRYSKPVELIPVPW